MEIKKVHPINIKELEANRCKIDENIKKSIILYNAAIGEMRKGNFNLAINDLQKALSYNNSFLEAAKFMGLCYINMNEYRKALKVFKKLKKDPMYNELGNDYIRSLVIKKSSYKNISSVHNKHASVGKHSKVNVVLSLLIVIVLIGGVSINYFYPEIIALGAVKFKTSIQAVQEKFKVNNKIDDSKEETVINSKENIIPNEEEKNAQKNLEDAKLEVNNYKNDAGNSLNDAEKLISDGSYENAASILIGLKNISFDNETQIKFDKLWQSLKPNPLWNIYSDGNKLYKEKKYGEALPKLIIVSEIDPNLDLMPWITFQIGMCYKETNDNTNAIIYFNKVKDNYPKSQYSANAQMMISQIGN